MLLQPGTIIKSTTSLADTYFEATTVLITEYNADGAVGFILNRPHARKLNELEEFKDVTSFPLHEGGPVDQEHLFFIHRNPQLIDGGLDLKNTIYFGGDFKQVIRGIRNRRLTTNDIKIFIGYCGWDIGELEAEIEEGSWVIEDNLLAQLFELPEG